MNFIQKTVLAGTLLASLSAYSAGQKICSTDIVLSATSDEQTRVSTIKVINNGEKNSLKDVYDFSYVKPCEKSYEQPAKCSSGKINDVGVTAYFSYSDDMIQYQIDNKRLEKMTTDKNTGYQYPILSENTFNGFINVPEKGVLKRTISESLTPKQIISVSIENKHCVELNQ